MPTDASVESRLILSDELARSLVKGYGTPLYVLDEAHLRGRVKRYLSAFAAACDRSELTYASKANSTFAVLAIVASEGCMIDVASEGELRAAIAAGVPASKCHFHGNAKTADEIAFAIGAGINQIVMDNFDEIRTIAAAGNSSPDLVLRLAPGVDPKTHEKIATGQADTKFGFNVADGSAESALLLCLKLRLPVIGFHCHVGSQLLDPTAQINGGQIVAEFASQMRSVHGFETTVLNVGGGIGIRYCEEDEPEEVERYCADLVNGVRSGLADSGLDPVLVQEPGRWLVGESGVTLYRVMNVKTVPIEGGSRIYVSVDGGLSDNPRPAMYGSSYPVRLIAADGRKGADPIKVRVSGKHCETDTLFDNVSLPGDTLCGDILQVLCTGAYNSSMASNYNRYPRPATALVRTDGSHCLVQERESWDGMFAREIVPEGLGNGR
ncbi:MAG: diaminopimelate decarboxylase [Armatimonadetes bacterium]|nr:diaminopimelate decarboxylase [Armatimonadota bacterium]